MESKHVPLGESRKQACKYKLVTKEMKKGASCFHVNRTWVGCAVGVICICSIVANVVTLMLYAGLHREVEKQRVAVNKINAFLSQHESFNAGHNKRHPNSDGDWSKLQGASGHAGHRGHRRKNARRHRRHQNDQRIQRRPVTQLKGIGDNRGPAPSEGYLLWHRPRPGIFANSFNYEFVGAQVKSIQIKTSGVYMVHSKVAINGKLIGNDVSECGHEVVRARGAGNDIHLLMKSVITQDREGRAYPRRTISGGRSYPLDTQVQWGIFHLIRDDKLRVQISEYCRAYTRVSMNETFTNFGAFLISEM